MKSPVEPIEGEPGCFLVESLSRPELKHRVEVEDGDVICMCERAACHNEKECRHVLLVLAWIDGYKTGRHNIHFYPHATR